MDRESIERIRTATFAVGRRGYEKREVDRFLSRLADWLESGGGDDSRSQVIRDELKRVGEQTSKILTDAHEIAERMRSEAEGHSKKVRSEADAYAERVRIEADQYSSEQRGEADGYLSRVRGEAGNEAAELREHAERQAQELAAAAAQRRQELEGEIADLEERREAVVQNMQRLSTQLVGTAEEHGSAHPPTSGEEFDDDELTVVAEVGEDAEPEAPYADEAELDVEEAEFEEYEDEIEDEAAAADGAVGGETAEFDVESELAEESPEPSQGDK
jgi:DivIVA domain-containing protein